MDDYPAHGAGKTREDNRQAQGEREAVVVHDQNEKRNPDGRWKVTGHDGRRHYIQEAAHYGTRAPREVF